MGAWPQQMFSHSNAVLGMREGNAELCRFSPLRGPILQKVDKGQTFPEPSLRTKPGRGEGLLSSREHSMVVFQWEGLLTNLE